jgi:hypothetical protein
MHRLMRLRVDEHAKVRGRKVVPTAVKPMETAVLAGFQIAYWSAICGHHRRVASQAVPPT